MMKLQQSSVVRNALIAGALLLAAFFPFARIILTPGDLAYHGDINLMYMLDIPVREASAAGQFPLWNPYAGAGTPALADSQTSALYLPAMILRFLPRSAMFNWGAVFHIWIGGLGMYALLRDMNAQRSAALVSAFSYMFSGIIMPRILAGHVIYIYAAAWPPLILLCYRRLLTFRPELAWYLFPATILCALQITTGHLPYVMITLFTLAVYFVFIAVQLISARELSKVVRLVGWSIVIILGALGLAAIQLVPSIEWFQQIVRNHGLSYQGASSGSVLVAHLPILIIPNIWFDTATATPLGFAPVWEVSGFAGLITLMLCFPALISPSRKPEAWYFAAAALLGLLVAVKYSPLFRLIYALVPYFRVPGRYMYLWTFGISGLGGLGLDSLLMQAENRSDFAGRVFGIAARTLGVLIGATVTGLIVWLLAGSRLFNMAQEQGLFTWLEPQVFLQAQTRNLLILLLTLFMATLCLFVIVRQHVTTSTGGWVIMGAVLIEMLIYAAGLAIPYAETNLYDPQDPLAKLDLSLSEVRIDGRRTSPNYGVPTIEYRWDGGNLDTMDHLLRLGLRGRQALAALYQVSRNQLSDPSLKEVKHQGDAYLYEASDNWPRIYAAPSIQTVR